jgi:urease alpha subunit
MGDANASIPTPQPVIGREMFGARAGAIGHAHGGRPGWANSISFVSQLSLQTGTISEYGLNKRVEAVRRCRGIGKADMRWNSTLPKINVDPETYEVMVDGQVCQMTPATSVPLSTNYFLF